MKFMLITVFGQSTPVSPNSGGAAEPHRFGGTVISHTLMLRVWFFSAGIEKLVRVNGKIEKARHRMILGEIVHMS